MYMWEGSNCLANRSYVCLISDLPVPKKSINCLGSARLLSGQNLLPIPPAMMTTYAFSLFIACLKNPFPVEVVNMHHTDIFTQFNDDNLRYFALAYLLCQCHS